jgi:DNA-binding beta-propeller fold protein YncE
VFASVLYVAVLFVAADPRQTLKELQMGASGSSAPESLAFSPDGSILAVADRGAGRIVFLAAADGAIRAEARLRGRPAGIAWIDARRVLVSENGAGALAEVDAGSATVLRRIPVARYAEGVAVVPGGREAVVCDRGKHGVQIVDLDSGKVKAEIPAVHQPWRAAVTPDGALVVVANLLPLGDARRGDLAANLTLIDLRNRTRIKDLALPAGAVNVRGLAISADGRWAYALHNVARSENDTTRLERGWLMANAVSVVDLRGRALLGSRVLDSLEDGAANPWGAALTPDGRYLWTALSGTHEAARLDLDNLHRLLGSSRCGGADGAPAGEAAPLDLDCDWDMGEACSAFFPPIVCRIGLPGNGPRGVAVAPGGCVAIAQYFSGDVVFLRGTDKPGTTVAIGPRTAETAARRGERAFHDAQFSSGRWLSCASCHPDGRADGLNWDLLNDGRGNPKNTKSLVWSDRTPPMMATGVRKSMKEAVAKGFENILFAAVPTQVVEDVCAYLRTLEPEPSPYLDEGGRLRAEAKRGQGVFVSAGCIRCHPPPLWTDLRSYDVGTGRGRDPVAALDTPTCAELWRTAPYLHDGSAATLREVLTTRNAGDRHGATIALSELDMEALVRYVESAPAKGEEP